MIVTPDEMRAVEDVAFANGSTAESLMDAVGERIAARIYQWVGREPATVLFYAGKGNNAGDVLVAAGSLLRWVEASGSKVRLRLRLALEEPADLGELPRRKLDALPDGIERCSKQQARVFGGYPERLLVIDGLLGIGARGNLREPIRGATCEINILRREYGAYVLSVDVPTGLDAETGEADNDAVVADETLAIGHAKTGLIADAAVNFVGKLNVVTLPEFSPAGFRVQGAMERGKLVSSDNLRSLLPPRPHESNKGMFGRIGILAGSVGATGAAVMCAHGCARAGAGLITLLTHPDIYPVVAGAASPEVMVKPIPRLLDVLDMDFDVLGLGPGLGREHGQEVRELIARWPKPMVVDADGLNSLAEDMDTLGHPAGPRLLTPHPGEMKRLLRGSPQLRSLADEQKCQRAQIAREFTNCYPVTLLFKGARTIIAERGLPLAYNTTGNAGMATGGMGDVLTGICCGLAGQKLALYDAARFGAWLHGHAADLGRADGESEESLLPMDLLAFLGRAYSSLRQTAR